MTRIVAEKMAAEDVSGTGRLAAFVRYGLRLLMTTVGILLIGFGLLSVVLIPLVNDASYADSAKYIGSTFIVLGVLILWRSRSAPSSWRRAGGRTTPLGWTTWVSVNSKTSSPTS